MTYVPATPAAMAEFYSSGEGGYVKVVVTSMTLMDDLKVKPISIISYINYA